MLNSPTKPPPPSISADADSVTESGATLTAANVAGDWHYRQTMPEAGECLGPESGADITLTSLEADTAYTYGLYADAACADELDSVEFTTKPSMDAGLARLGLASGAAGMPTLSPAFSPDADTYSASLPFAAPSLLLTPQTAHPDATARVGPRGGSLVAVPADGSGTTVSLAVGENVIVIEVTAGDGITTRTITLTATRAAPGPLDAAAAHSHLFPLFANGGGFRTQIWIAGADGGRGRCELTLHGAGLDAARFAAEPASALATPPPTTPGAFGIHLDARGGDVVLNSAGAGELVIGHARLDCDEPVSAQLLLTLEAGGELTAMANQQSAFPARRFLLPALPPPLRLGLAFASEDAARGNLCVLEALDGSLGRGEVLPAAGGNGLPLSRRDSPTGGRRRSWPGIWPGVGALRATGGAAGAAARGKRVHRLGGGRPAR